MIESQLCDITLVGLTSATIKVVSTTNITIESQSGDVSGGRVGGVHRYVQLLSLGLSFIVNFWNKLGKHNNFGMSTLQKLLILNKKINI